MFIPRGLVLILLFSDLFALGYAMQDKAMPDPGVDIYGNHKDAVIRILK